MPYKLKTINTSENIVCFDNISYQGLQYAFVEANLKDTRAFCPESNLNTLLLDSLKQIPKGLSMSEFPKKLADAIEEVLTERVKHYPYLAQVGYVGIASENNTINICKAGNNRVHLIEKSKMTEITRDHNLIDDPVEEISNLDPSFQMRNFYKSVPTRLISYRQNDVKHNAESITWKARENFILLICSSSFYRFREPEEYLWDYLQMVDEDYIQDNEIGGLLTKIEYFSD